MVGSGPGGLLYPYGVRGYRKSTSPDRWKNSLAHRKVNDAANQHLTRRANSDI